jgi:hypothetical protein
MAAENVFATQVGIGMLSSAALNLLKRLKWVTMVTDHSVAINHVFLIATSAAGALGVHMAWNASGHSLTITGLDFTAVAGSFWLWFKQWSIQYLVHKGAFGPVAEPAPVPAPAPQP